MTWDRVRMGVVGTGHIAQNRHLPSYQRNDRVVVVAAADPVPEAVRGAAAAFLAGLTFSPRPKPGGPR